jgi:putative FmdB family regulatory protein
MPVYVYACASCGHGFETRQGFNDARLTICPECGGSIRRVVQPVGIVFKGSGFYRNDSRKTTESTAQSSEPKPESTPAAIDAPAAAASTPASGGAAPSSPAAPAPQAASGDSKSRSTAGESKSRSTTAASAT